MKRSRARGFTLLELLVALSILLMSFSVIMQIFAAAARTARLTADYQAAVEIAETLLTDLEAEEALATGTRSGDLDERYHWQVRIEPYGEPARSPFSLNLVTAEVVWQDAGRDNNAVSLTTLRLSRQR